MFFPQSTWDVISYMYIVDRQWGYIERTLGKLKAPRASRSFPVTQLTVHSVIRLYNTKKSSASIQQAGANILSLSCTLSKCRPSSWLPTYVHDLEEYSSQIVQPLYMRRKKMSESISKGKRYSTLTPKSTNSCRCHAWKIIVAILSRSLLNEGRWHRFPSVCTFVLCSSMYTIMLYYIEMLHHRSIFGREKKIILYPLSDRF